MTSNYWGRKSFRRRSIFDFEGMQKEAALLEEALSEEGVWKRQKEAHEMSERLQGLREELSRWRMLEKDYFALKSDTEALEAIEAGEGTRDEGLWAEVRQRYKALSSQFEQEEINLFFSGKYDKGSAVLALSAGAGGRDAQDWAEMLMRMYQRYAERKGFEVVLLDESRGEEGGIKSALLEIRGRFAYGYLRGESGVHRLVRISPFSSQQLRHTSFASVEVLPDIKEQDTHIELKDEDIEIDTFRSSGPGGQYVNRRESAVRVRHKPTGIAVAVQSERLQGQNRARALALLKAKLAYLQELAYHKELEAARGERKAAEWGNQIRSYVLHPYKLAKDHRTGEETAQVEGVLDGALDLFVEKEIRMRPREKHETR